MPRVIVFCIISGITVYPQLKQFYFQSEENKKKFADYLFCEGDYLRAVEEYESIRESIKNDTVDFKILLCYSNLNLNESINSIRLKKAYNMQSPFIYDIQFIYLKNDFLNSSHVFYDAYSSGETGFQENSVYYNGFNKLRMFSYLFYDSIPVGRNDFLEPFGADDKDKIAFFYDWAVDPPYKSPALAGIFSAIIPGSGKMYIGEWGDGITALITTGLFAFLAYDNFRADHSTRAWIFTGLGAFFYAGNIYGSVAAAQIFNARINFEFENGLNLFLEQNNYFMPEYDLCN